MTGRGRGVDDLLAGARLLARRDRQLICLITRRSVTSTRYYGRHESRHERRATRHCVICTSCCACLLAESLRRAKHTNPKRVADLCISGLCIRSVERLLTDLNQIK